MHKRKLTVSIILIVAFSLAFIMPAYAQDKQGKKILTLEEIQQLAIENSRSLETLDLMIDQIDRQVRILTRDLTNLRYGGSIQVYDSLQYAQQTLGGLEQQKQSISGSDDYSDEQQKLLLAGVEMQIGNTHSTIMTLQQDQSSISSAQRDLRKAVESAEDTQEDIERLREEAELQLEQGVAELAFGILQAENGIKLLDKSYNQYLKMTEIERVKKDLGMNIQVDIDQTAVNASDLSKQRDRLQENHKVLLRQLNDMMGRDPDSSLEIVRYQVPQSIIPAPSYQTIIDEIIENHYKFYTLERDIERLEDDLDDTDGSHEQSILRSDIKQKEIEQKDKKLEVENKVKQLLGDYTEKARSYQLAQVSYRSAAQEYEWEQMKYEIGITSLLQLTGSELQYLQSQNEMIVKGYDYQLIKNKLDLAMEGIL